MKEQWPREDQAIQAIEHSAVPRNQRTHVLNANVTLYDTDREITDLPSYPNDRPGQ